MKKMLTVAMLVVAAMTTGCTVTFGGGGLRARPTTSFTDSETTRAHELGTGAGRPSIYHGPSGPEKVWN
jgi:hypothetical protein